MPLKKHTDEELMVQIMDHDSHPAMVELHARYSGRILGYFIKMLNKDVHLAQDFVQDLFLKIMEKKHLFDPDKKFYTWIFTIASNMCKTNYRTANRSVTFEPEKHNQIRAQYNEDFAEKKIFMDLLQTSIARLDDNHKEAFVLRFLEHFSLKEIAQIMECSLGTVKSRLFYATKKIGEQIKEFDPSFEPHLFKLL